LDTREGVEIMFYCKECRDKKGWPVSIFRSLGNCEVCGEQAACYDIPSKYLHEDSEEKEE
jgi:hypothetical protein